jgi:hypothetical protein
MKRVLDILLMGSVFGVAKCVMGFLVIQILWGVFRDWKIGLMAGLIYAACSICYTLSEKQ